MSSVQKTSAERPSAMEPSTAHKDIADMSSSAATPQQQGAESDVDELVDSDTEKGLKISTPRNSKSKSKAHSSRKSSTKADTSAQEKKKPNDSQDSKFSSKYQDISRPGSNAPSRRSSPARATPGKTSHEFGEPSQSSSREMLGRTATGGPVPYYYPQPNMHAGQSSPRVQQGNATRKTGDAGKAPQNLKTELAGYESDDLSSQEVDKFLDLIEKYNLDTSNEDDMAKSVTELYQEWLEWCAKRNVQSTKSKQALVAEFVRIHHGAYGVARQQRAMEIVQGSQSTESSDNATAAFDRYAAGHSQRAPRTSNSGRDVEPNRGLPRARPLESHTAASASRSLPSPAVVPRSLTPGGTIYEEPYGKAIPLPILEDLHRQIRDDVIQEASIMMQQMLHEQAKDFIAENNMLARKIEQLEIHSDNLAQWVQHLNRVQEDMSSSARLPLPQDREAAPVLRDDLRDGMGREPHPCHVSHVDQRGYPPPSGYSVASPKRSYAVPARGSVSPHMAHSSSSRMLPPHDMYDRPGSKTMVSQPPYRESPRTSHLHSPHPSMYYDGRGPPHAGRSFYSGTSVLPPDERTQHTAVHPPSPPASDPRHLKRARNGY